MGLVAVASPLPAQEGGLEAKLPAAVKKTFRAKFPKGEIQKLEAEVENGVRVYDLEFKDADVEKETDITEGGTMLEYTVVVDAKDVPATVMKAIRKEAEGATIKRIEWIEISYETRDGKTVKLAKPVVHYAVEMTRGKRTAEAVLSPDGRLLEPANWSGDREKDEADRK
jgi:hypothetical protein